MSLRSMTAPTRRSMWTARWMCPCRSPATSVWTLIRWNWVSFPNQPASCTTASWMTSHFINGRLSPADIQLIYLTGLGGKCPPIRPPIITSQPVSQTNYVGLTATLSVTATGGLPLSYQWSLNTTNIPGSHEYDAGANQPATDPIRQLLSFHHQHLWRHQQRDCDANGQSLAILRTGTFWHH